MILLVDNVNHSSQDLVVDKNNSINVLDCNFPRNTLSFQVKEL